MRSFIAILSFAAAVLLVPSCSGHSCDRDACAAAASPQIGAHIGAGIAGVIACETDSYGNDRIGIFPKNSLETFAKPAAGAASR